MTLYITGFKVSGSKVYCHLYGDTENEVREIAKEEGIKLPTKQGKRFHLSLSVSQATRILIHDEFTNKICSYRGGDLIE